MADRSLYRVRNETREADLATACRRVTGPVERGVGLIGRKGLPPGGGLIIQPCNSVVSFFMRFAIDVLFVDGDGQVKSTLHSMKPWRTSSIVRGSKFVVELPAGTLQQTATQLGDRIVVEPVA